MCNELPRGGIHYFVFVFVALMLLCFPKGLLAEVVTPSPRWDHSIRWTEIQVDDDERLVPVRLINETDFWCRGVDGQLHHYRDGEWEHLAPCSPGARSYFYFWTANQTLFCAAIQNDYHTRFFRYNGRKWIYEDFSATLPARHFVETDDGIIWVASDWGELFRRDLRGRWEQVETPFEHHIVAAASLDGVRLLFEVREDGLFEYDGVSFRSVEWKERNHLEIEELFIQSADSVLFETRDRTLFRMVSGNVEAVDVIIDGKRCRWIDMSQGGFAKLFRTDESVYFFDEKEWFGLTPPFMNELAVRLLFTASGVFLVVDNNGSLHLGKLATGTHFYNLATRFRVQGSPVDYTIGAGLIDLNGDQHSDLFLLNSGPLQYNQLFLNLGSEPFADVSKESGVRAMPQSNLFDFGDLNRDGLSDLVLVGEDSVGVVIHWFASEGQGRFGAGKQIPFDYLPHLDPQNMNLVDADEDGDLDIHLTYYYGDGPDRRGRNILLENRFFGRIWKKHEEFSNAMVGWNQATLFRDFNNDGFLDAFVLTRWIRNRLYFGSVGGFKDVSNEVVRDTSRSNSTSAVAFDMDVDGDFDLIVNGYDVPVLYFENCGEDGLVPRRSLDFPEVLKTFLSATIQFHVVDLDLDGFEDLLVSGNDRNGWRTLALRNVEGKRFENVTLEMGFADSDVSGARGIISGDVDGDGDQDLFAVGIGENALWLNQLNDDRAVHVRLRGGKSNVDAQHALCWLYEAGYVGDQEKLAGFRCFDSHRAEVFAGSYYSCGALSFGVDPEKRYDLVVQFLGGKRLVMKDVKAGDRLFVSESGLLGMWLAYLPGRLMSVSARPEVQFYSLGFVLSLFAILSGARVAHVVFRWKAERIVLLALFNLSLFWVMLMLTSSSASASRFVVPPFFVVIGIALPIAFGYSMKLGAGGRVARRQKQDELLQLLLVFSHGEWALSNLNSIKRLGEYILEQENVSERHWEQYDERARTFCDMTARNLARIGELGAYLHLVPDAIERLCANSTWLQERLPVLREVPVSSGALMSRRLGNAVDEIRDDLRTLKNEVYRLYSCNVGAVVRQTVDSLHEHFVAGGIEAPGVDIPVKTVWGLIPGFDLAAVLDNNLQNSIAAMAGSVVKQIFIQVVQSGAKVQIIISDTGCGVSEEFESKIFEPGVSGSGGTGQGLAQAKSSLAKYGGNIDLSRDPGANGATFVIRLNEGRENLETIHSHRR